MSAGKPVEISKDYTANCCGTMLLQPDKCLLKWIIKNFSLSEHSEGEAIRSCTFSSDPISEDSERLRYHLDLYLKGTPRSPDDVVVGIWASIGKADIRSVLFKCFVFDVKSELAFYEKSGKFIASSDGTCYHEVALVKREELLKRKDELLPGDNLTLVCVVSSSLKETNEFCNSKL